MDWTRQTTVAPANPARNAACAPAVRKSIAKLSEGSGSPVRFLLPLRRSGPRLRSIVDALDDVTPASGAALIADANKVVQEQVVAHERDDERNVYPRLAGILQERHGLSALSRAHREILHLARVVEDLPTEKVDRYLIRDAQRIIEALVRIYTAQEEDIYEAVAGPDGGVIRRSAQSA
jgi:Hemerythrin HHE cation binding domain